MMLTHDDDSHDANKPEQAERERERRKEAERQRDLACAELRNAGYKANVLTRERDKARHDADALKRALPHGWGEHAWFAVCDRLIAQEKRLKLLENANAAQARWVSVSARIYMRMLEAVAHDKSRLLDGPCLWCEYNGAGYWQPGTHQPDCPWHEVGGKHEREGQLPLLLRAALDADSDDTLGKFNALIAEESAPIDQAVERMKEPASPEPADDVAREHEMVTNAVIAIRNEGGSAPAKNLRAILHELIAVVRREEREACAHWLRERMCWTGDGWEWAPSKEDYREAPETLMRDRALDEGGRGNG